jgi:putative ABC transport system substrate-binding protein
LVLRVLKGEQPGEIPVEGIEITELHVNPAAAAAMGATIPAPVLARAKTVVN